jgi:hypothetical protein
MRIKLEYHLTRKDGILADGVRAARRVQIVMIYVAVIGRNNVEQMIFHSSWEGARRTGAAHSVVDAVSGDCVS